MTVATSFEVIWPKLDKAKINNRTRAPVNSPAHFFRCPSNVELRMEKAGWLCVNRSAFCILHSALIGALLFSLWNSFLNFVICLPQTSPHANAQNQLDKLETIVAVQ